VPCPGKVLIVDDDAELLTTLADVLASRERCGAAAVVTASDGVQALAFLRSGLRPCCIVTDLAMPHMTGDEFVQALGGDAFRDIPVITMTGALRSPPPGASAHLKKPFTLDEFEHAVGSTARGECRIRRCQP
jgi:CheY-like chemotaxis protein